MIVSVNSVLSARVNDEIIADAMEKIWCLVMNLPDDLFEICLQLIKIFM